MFFPPFFEFAVGGGWRDGKGRSLRRYYPDQVQRVAPVRELSGARLHPCGLF